MWSSPPAAARSYWRPRARELLTSRTLFDGFLAAYREGDPAGDAEPERALPAMAEGEHVFVTGVRPTHRFTRPPSRYSEAATSSAGSKNSASAGPSTYAAIVGVLRERG